MLVCIVELIYGIFLTRSDNNIDAVLYFPQYNK